MYYRFLGKWISYCPALPDGVTNQNVKQCCPSLCISVNWYLWYLENRSIDFFLNLDGFRSRYIKIRKNPVFVSSDLYPEVNFCNFFRNFFTRKNIFYTFNKIYELILMKFFPEKIQVQGCVQNQPEIIPMHTSGGKFF